MCSILLIPLRISAMYIDALTIIVMSLLVFIDEGLASYIKLSSSKRAVVMEKISNASNLV